MSVLAQFEALSHTKRKTAEHFCTKRFQIMTSTKYK